MIALTPDEQLAFWNAHQQPVRLSEAQRQLGAIMRGVSGVRFPGRTFAFVAVILDRISDRAKAFYRKWDFEELPGSPYRLFVSTRQLEAKMQVP